MATLAIFPERFVYSMGIAGAIVVLAAGAFALFVLPSLLTVFGARIAAHTPSSHHPTSMATETQTTGRWYRIATLVMRRPAIWALVCSPGARGPGRTVPARLVHRGRRQRPAGQQLRRHRLQAGPDQLHRLLRSAGHHRRQRRPGHAERAGFDCHSGGCGAGRQSRLHVRAPGGLPVGIQRGPVLSTPVARRAENGERPPITAWPRTAHRRRADRLLPGAPAQPQIPPPARARADRPDRPGDALRNDPLGGPPADWPWS